MHLDLFYKLELIPINWPVVCQICFNHKFREWEVFTSVCQTPCNFETDWSSKPHGPVVSMILFPDSWRDQKLYGKVLKAGQCDLAVGVHFQLKTWKTCSHPSRLQWAPNKMTLATNFTSLYVGCLFSTQPDTFSAKQYWPIGFLAQFPLLLHVSWHVYSTSN